MRTFEKGLAKKMIVALPKNQLFEAMLASNKNRLIILAKVHKDKEHIQLVRGNGKWFTVPFAHFPVSGDGTKPDFDRVSLTDYGQTLKLGEYEASVEAILQDMSD